MINHWLSNVRLAFWLTAKNNEFQRSCVGWGFDDFYSTFVVTQYDQDGFHNWFMKNLKIGRLGVEFTLEVTKNNVLKECWHLGDPEIVYWTMPMKKVAFHSDYAGTLKSKYFSF